MKRLCGFVLMTLGLAVAAGCGDARPENLKEQDGVKYEDLQEGDGPEVKEGDWVKVHYTGWLQENGKKFDSSFDHPGKEPLVFKLGAGKVIKGWDRGVAGMRAGGKRMLYIPAKLAYGSRGAGRGAIPPNADLKFEVELLGVVAVTYEDVKVGDGQEARKGDTVLVHYTGWLEKGGKKFDSSFDHPGKQPLRFTIGAGDVIPGWDEGVPGMKVGGKRVLHIPAALGYGSRGSPPDIPPNADLKFEVELVKIAQ